MQKNYLIADRRPPSWYIPGPDTPFWIDIRTIGAFYQRFFGAWTPMAFHNNVNYNRLQLQRIKDIMGHA